MAQHRNALPTCVSYRRPEVSRRDYILSFSAVYRRFNQTADASAQPIKAARVYTEHGLLRPVRHAALE
jgi:hypothetical protein